MKSILAADMLINQSLGLLDHSLVHALIPRVRHLSARSRPQPWLPRIRQRSG
jgi:hypothetical protein